MSFRNTAILLVVLVLLGGAAFWVNRQGGTEADTDATPTPALLTSLAPDDVASITVEQGEQSITVERQDDGWAIAGDSPEPAGETKVNQALNQLTSLRPTRVLDDVQNAADFGLEEPAWTITLAPNSGDAVVYRIGDENPRGTSRYLQVDGDAAVRLVPKSSVETVQAWLETPPHPPTPTPEPTATPAATEMPAATPEATATPSS